MSSRRTLVIRLRRASDVERLGRDQFINRDALSCSAGESGADAGTEPMREVYCARIRDAAASAALDGARAREPRFDDVRTMGVASRRPMSRIGDAARRARRE